MATIETVLQGFSVNTSEGRLSYCGVTLLRGAHTTLVDVAHMGRRDVLITRLKALGLELEDIDRVVLTHGHWDHIHNLSLFPNAEVILHRDERDYLRLPHPHDWATPVWTEAILAGAKQVSTVEDGDELEAGVRILAAPGHSPGSMAVLVDTPDGIAGMVGDALPSRAATSYMGPAIVFYDEDAAYRSAQRIADSCRFFYPGHDRPFRSENGGYHYIESASLTVYGVPRDEDGRVLGAFEDAPPVTGPQIMPSARRAARNV